MIQLKAGQWLYASCSAEWYGPILRVGKDAGGADVIDIRLPLNEFLTYDHFGDTSAPDGPHPLTKVIKHENPDRILVAADFLEEHGFDEAAKFLRETSVEALFIDLMWKPVDDERINLNVPGDGCYRCTQLFWVHDERG